MRLLTFVALVALLAFAGTGRAEEPADTRAYWAYEGGWFAKLKDGSWYELNEQTYRVADKPSKFKEIGRTNGYVELYDDSRGMGVRLYDNAMYYNPDGRGWRGPHAGFWESGNPFRR